ncbi:hypothetical protein [Bacteroides neonati]|uniref:hypothetical protein n=1 Tax=Bacteroides neonati TaxID=1347393 RepID=UPI0004AE8098|nr:hypothetical protein [Bacteroides neonati]
MNEKEIIAKASELAMAKAKEIVEKQFSDVGCMDAKLRLLSIKNDIMDGVRICLELIKQPV